jgi:hypothetical protein
MSSLYRVAWKCVATSIQSHGSWTSYEAAKDWMVYGNEKWGTNLWARRQAWRQVLDEEDDGMVIEHWLESQLLQQSEDNSKKGASP